MARRNRRKIFKGLDEIQELLDREDSRRLYFGKCAYCGRALGLQTGIGCGTNLGRGSESATTRGTAMLSGNRKRMQPSGEQCENNEQAREERE